MKIQWEKDEKGTYRIYILYIYIYMFVLRQE